MKPFAYFLCALVILLVAISPWLILSYYEKLPEEPYFQGILHIWHISDWRTGGSSAAAFLASRIKQYEAQNPHVFIELETYTPDEATTAIQFGQKPDIISYPYGKGPSLELAPLPRQSFLLLNDEDTAYPYMFGGYCLIVNNDLLSENGIGTYDDWGIRPDALLEAAELGAAFDSEPGYSALPALALHQYPPLEKPNKYTWNEPEMPDAALGLKAAYSDGLSAFCKGETAVLIASHRQLFDVTERYTQGEAPTFTAYAIGGYTDMAQMLGVTVQEDELRQNACEDFASYLVSAPSQKKLEAIGVFPVIANVDIYSENEVLKAVYDQLSQSGVFVKPEDRQTLEALAMDAFGGSDTALQKLRKLLSKSS